MPTVRVFVMGPLAYFFWDWVEDYLCCALCESKLDLRDVEDVSDSGVNAAASLDGLALTSDAATEVCRRRESGGFVGHVAIRVEPVQNADCRVLFDYPYSDGRDWIGISHGIAVLYDKRDAGLTAGRVVDFQDGVFQILDSPKDTFAV